MAVPHARLIGSRSATNTVYRRRMFQLIDGALDRRDMLKAGALGVGGLMLPQRLFATPARGFTHGVASGDPQQSEVTLWTRFLGAVDEPQRLRVEVADDLAFRKVRACGEAIASADSDNCASARVTGLAAGRWYYYRFRSLSGETSVIGRTRTLPKGRLDRFRIAVMSCANATSGWFNAYAHAAARDDIDLVVHLGDYIYESPIDRSDALPHLAAGRGVRPPHETIALVDYRARYASYRADPDLAALHRMFPMIAIQDDHESANNAWVNGASGHQPEEGSWSSRKAAALRAWSEWLPMSAKPYDRYQIGDLATLFRIETRLVGRDKQLNIAEAIAGKKDIAAAVAAFKTGPLADPNRTLMGMAQERWLLDGLAASAESGTRWQLLGQQVVMGTTYLPQTAASWLGPAIARSSQQQRGIDIAVALSRAGLPFGLDRWDGYPAARQRLLRGALAAGANLVTLSGDSHNGWAYELSVDGAPAGVEFAGQAVSSLGLEKRFEGNPAHIAADFIATNPGLKWCDTSRRGYMIVEFARDHARAEWVFLPSRDRRSVEVLGSASLVSEHGSGRLI